VDGEIDPRPLVDLALSAGKDCFLPVINRDTQETLSFAPFDAKTELIENQWGIAEPPLPEEDMSSTDFDVVFVPLVGFDANCFRLGMGKGFYDRTFSFKIFNRRSQPLLVGLAHDCQLTEPFPTESWDVRLDAVITAEKIYRPDTA
jgi:5-formyltetrahydrofolate cyclo-ligase